jgi:antitoxin VapB
MLAEEVGDLPLDPIEYPWTADRADAGFPVKLARRILGSDGPIGADWPVPDAARLEGAIAGARAPLTSHEIDRYRALGRDAGIAVGAAMRAMTPGLTEREAARRLNDAVAACDARAIVTLVAADERAAKFRHPVPTQKPWTRTLLAGICVERHGLIVALSRVVSVGEPDADLRARTTGAAHAFEALLDRSRPGATGAEIFAAVTEAYARAGFPGEEQRHHQGGATGYRSREWVAHPESRDRVTAPQAFAWNPTVRGAKIEETAIVTPGGVEIITSSPSWPAVDLHVQGGTVQAAIVAQIG